MTLRELLLDLSELRFLIRNGSGATRLFWLLGEIDDGNENYEWPETEYLQRAWRFSTLSACSNH